MRIPVTPILILALALPAIAPPAFALTAQDARTQSFKLLSEGMRLYKEGKFHEATEAFQRVVHINLNSFLAYYYLGICLIAERRYGESIEPLKTALDLQPDYMQAHMALGDACLKQGDAGEARAEYLRVLDLQPNFAAAYDGLGRLFESTGQDEMAETQYRKALEINVAYADPYTHLGDLFLRRNRLDEAAALFLKAISVKPDFAAAYTRLGLAYARLNRHDDAIAAARKSQALAPQDPEPYVALARIDLSLSSFRRAEADLQQALALDHDHPGAHLLLAELKRAEESFAAAQEVLEGLHERGIEDAQMRRAVAEALKSVKAASARYTALKAAADRTPPDPRDLIALARFLAAQGAHQRAADLLERAAAIGGDPGPVPALGPVPAGGPSAVIAGDSTRAAAPEPILLEAAGELCAARLFARAGTIYQQILDRAGTDADTHAAARFNLGVARAGLGLDEAAAEAFTSFLSEHPGDGPALLYLGNASFRLGRKEDARAAYKAFLETAGAGPETTQVERILKTIDAGRAAGSPAAASPQPKGAEQGGEP
jgi:tetratricopeptide (TPR) repeat protein